MISDNRIPFLNTYIDSLTSVEAKECVDKMVQSSDNDYIVTPNSDIIVKMQDDPELKDICEAASLILTDGQILVMLSKLTGEPIKERVCMTDFIWVVLDLCVEKGYSIFFLGGKEDVLNHAVNNIISKYPTLNVAGYYSPPFGFENDPTELEECNRIIRKSNADILIVFLGCPKQEKFIYYNREKYDIPLSITMGGCVDFLAGSVSRAPLWMQKWGLEWFYRFLQEPRRMFKRYFIDDMRIFGLAVKYRNKKGR